MAEGMGFEPTVRLSPYNGLANRRLQPLGHPSTGVFLTRRLQVLLLMLYKRSVKSLFIIQAVFLMIH